MQRGARMYFNYCSGCHSLKYMSYSRLGEDLKLSPEETLKSFAFTGAKIGDQVTTNMPEGASAQWFGKTPPDLSLEARAKNPDWIYNYLKSFYLDPSRPSGWNNTVFPNVSMPNVLWELQGTQRAVMSAAKPGEEPKVEKLDAGESGPRKRRSFNDTARDVTAFLHVRRRTGGDRARSDGCVGAPVPGLLHLHRVAAQARVLEGRALIRRAR